VNKGSITRRGKGSAKRATARDLQVAPYGKKLYKELRSIAGLGAKTQNIKSGKPSITSRKGLSRASQQSMTQSPHAATRMRAIMDSFFGTGKRKFASPSLNSPLKMPGQRSRKGVIGYGGPRKYKGVDAVRRSGAQRRARATVMTRSTRRNLRASL